MNLTPVFKPCTREELSTEFNIECGMAEWVSIEFPYNVVSEFDPNADPELTDEHNQVTYETNRYDATYYDRDHDKNLSIYIYMDEDSQNIIAIDDIVQDRDKNVRYNLHETPIAEAANAILSKTA